MSPQAGALCGQDMTDTTLETQVPDLPSATPAKAATLGQVDTSFYLIGVGASAGGLEAIKAMIGQIPDDYPHSLVFIQHISPDYKSLMGELLRRVTSLTVHEVEDDMPVEPGHVYVIPPKANVIIQGTDPGAGEIEPGPVTAATDETAGEAQGSVGLRFSLIAQPPRPQLNLPIDVFFQSLAEAVGDRAVAVILSGTGSDGSRGLRAIKDADGLVIVQDPETAAFDGMPQAAVDTQIVDLVLPPDEMIGELLRYFDLRQNGVINIDALFAGAEEVLDELLELASHEAQIDFLQYKTPTLKRRIARRMAFQKCATLEDYLELCRGDPGEAAVLCRGFLVGVTHFFRDLPAWDALLLDVIPQLFDDDDEDKPVKVWSVGCSTGEEAYTIAMLMETYRRENNIQRDFRIFATDANSDAISFAKEGIYPDEALEDIPEKYAVAFTSYLRGGIKITEMLRKKIIFSVHNATEGPPFINTDLLTCRNMLIYLNPTIQAQLLAMFSYSLRAERFLFLGVSESIDRGTARFRAVSARWRIFRNADKATLREFSNQLTNDLFAQRPRPAPRRLNLPAPGNGHSIMSDVFRSTLEDIETCVVIVDDSMSVVETFGDYRRHLFLPDDGFSANILDLVPPRLTSAISLLIRKAHREGAASQKGIRVPTEGQVVICEVHARRMLWEANHIVYAVTLRQSDIIDLNSPIDTSALPGPEPELLNEQSRNLIELETELEATRATLETAIEDLGVSNEELQTSNEELMSTNEELQATNEEIQSVNEELHTVNAEHAEKITELEAAYADIQNLLENTDLATVFLDENLRIRRFSAAIKVHFKLDQHDIGRPLAHFSSSLEADDNSRLLEDAGQALATGESKTYEVRSISGKWYLARLRPFTNQLGDKEGVVLTFVDITQITRLQAMQQEAQMRRDMLEGLLEGEAAGYWDFDFARQHEFLSPRFQQMFGYTEDEHPLTDWTEVLYPDDLAAEKRVFDDHIASKGERPYDIELRCKHKNGETVWVWRRGKVVEWGPRGEALRMVGCHIDITHLKLREADIIQRAKEIRRFTFISAHDLREPMNTVESFIRLLREEVGEDLGEDRLVMMDYISDTGRRMRAQIESMLEYAKLQDEALEFQIVDMQALAQNCVADLKQSITDCGAVVDISAMPRAKGSATLIARVLLNMIANAVKFHRSDVRPHITISGERQREGWNIYRIRDNGIGIEPQFRERVFEIFIRLHTRSEYDGTGLGLALCQKIVSKHGGSIWIEDGEDGGACFAFTLKDGETVP